jgi:ArsR family transcriptional regulator, arsenate/arsenite/antimonite-responsive transcriptional repressor
MARSACSGDVLEERRGKGIRRQQSCMLWGVANGRASNEGARSSPTFMAKKRTSRGVALSEEQFHAIGRALADPRRFAILKQVAAADGLPCSKLDEHEVISPATVSHHLRELNEAGLVEVERQGRCASISLRRPVWQAYLDRLSLL